MFSILVCVAICWLSCIGEEVEIEEIEGEVVGEWPGKQVEVILLQLTGFIIDTLKSFGCSQCHD